MSTSEKPRVRYVTHSVVRGVDERFTQEWIVGVGKEAVFRQRSLGWFLYLGGSFEAIYVGAEKPEFNVGDQVKITFEKDGAT